MHQKLPLEKYVSDGGSQAGCGYSRDYILQYTFPWGSVLASKQEPRLTSTQASGLVLPGPRWTAIGQGGRDEAELLPACLDADSLCCPMSRDHGWTLGACLF